jgi:hypothetical protein
MPFEDRFPFKNEPPPLRYEHEVARTAELSGTSPRADPAPSGYEGRRGIYRLAFKAMEIPGFPDRVTIGEATITQGQGPIWTQRTHIRQEPGPQPLFIKRMEWVAVGSEDFLTVCEIEITIPSDLTQAMHSWGDHGRAAVAILATLLDERVAQQQLAEDLLIFDEEGGQPEGAADHIERLRTFQAVNRMLDAHVEALDAVADLDLSSESPILAASRWYLRGAQLGLAPDAIVFFWVALEALAKPSYGTPLSNEESRRTDVRWVELAVEAAGLDPSIVQPSIGRLAGLRAEIVHGGVEHPELFSEGYYATEALARLLLRHKLGLGEMGWPLFPDESNLREPMKSEAARLHQFPQTEWRD